MKIGKNLLSVIISISLLLGLTVFCFPVSAEQTSLENYIVEQVDLMGRSDITQIDCSAYIDDYADHNTFVTELSSVINKVFTDHPEYFFCKLSDIERDTGIANFTYIDYASSDKLFADYAAIKAFAQDITADVASTLTDYEKALYLHDVLVESFTKGTNEEGRLDFDNADSGFYSLMYEYLLKLNSIESTKITDYATMHKWNALKLGDYWYFVDVYNDDNDNMGRISHSYFLLNESEIDSAYTAWSFSNISLAGDTAYSDDVIKTARTKVFIGDDYKFVNTVGEFVSCDRTTKVVSSMYSVNSSWTSFSDNGYYSGNYSALAELEGYYLITTPKSVIAYKDSAGVLYNIESTTSEIYGLYVNENGLVNVVLKTTDSSDVFTEESLNFELNVDVVDEYVKVGEEIDGNNIAVNISYVGEEINIKVGNDIDLSECTISATTDTVKKGSGTVEYNGQSVNFDYTTYILGDISRNGTLDAADVLYLRAALLNKKTLNADELMSAKVSEDGQSINSLDLLLLKNLTLNIN